jgi:acetolactate synthase-1/2/3 large subunit
LTTLDNYGDQICDLLVDLNYTHCFFVAGGNIMHILNSASKKFKCIPVIHEVSAGIAAEFFNEANRDSNSRAFALVTAGPGLTNLITAIAGAYLESRELLVIGGQVKTADLKTESLRQNGIQEIDGISLVESVTLRRLRLDKTFEISQVRNLIEIENGVRKGPVFLEFCLDIQAAPKIKKSAISEPSDAPKHDNDFSSFFQNFSSYKRPVLLLGGGVSRSFVSKNRVAFEEIPFPIMTTWNAADRIDSNQQNYMGRPNTWGQRSANVILQQADLIMAVGTRLGLQQTGFNWQGFGPLADIVHVDVDAYELNRANLKTKFKYQCDAHYFLAQFLALDKTDLYEDWIDFSKSVREILPLSESSNVVQGDFWNPYDFVLQLSQILVSSDSIIPSSSGAAETVTMQALQQVDGNTVITNKGLASMGYGLAGAIGVAFKTGKRVIHLEGDGGFAQNLQEIGTVAKNQLPIKTFLFCNSGYASIRMTQKSYFGGSYMGCDAETGLGLPNWEAIFEAYGIGVTTLNPKGGLNDEFLEKFNDLSPRAFLIPIHPEQTYYPKITSKVLDNGQMESNPLHLMTPELAPEVAARVYRYLHI